MFLKLGNLNMYYEEVNSEKEKTIIFLHGWGLSQEEFSEFKLLDCRFVAVDFVGFGKSSKIDRAYNLYDYVYHIHALVEQLNITNPILVGHSFGGRVAILYSYLYNTSKVILVNSAGIRKKKRVKDYIKLYFFKVDKFISKLFNKKRYLYLKSKGSGDYQVLNDVERKSFSKIVNFDLKKYLSKIKTPTLILSGVYDDVVPFQDGVVMHQLLDRSQFIPFFNSGHFIYKSEKGKFIDCLVRFIA